MTEKFSVFKIDIGYFFRAEFTHSFAPNTEPLWTWHNISPFYLEGSETDVPILNNSTDWMGHSDLIRHPVQVEEEPEVLLFSALPL